MQFEFATTAKIIFGSGKLDSVGSITREYGDTALIISGAPQEITDKLLKLLGALRIKFSLIKIENEPTIVNIREIVAFAQRNPSTVVIGIGGGSALDTAKAAAALMTNHGDLTDYLEVIGLNKPLINPSLPLIAIPTTSGTGSEVTRNAVIGSPDHHLKVSLRGQQLLPRVVIVDPELTLSVPPSITAITGLDALTQLIEPFTSNNTNPLTDAICQEGIKHIAQAFYRAYDNGRDIYAREDMSLASLFGGLALANAKLGAVHGLAGPIGGEIPARHGAICARLLPIVMETNISSLTTRLPNHPALERYGLIGRLLSGESSATAETAIQWVRNFCLHTNIHPLSSYGLTKALFPKIIEHALKSSSMKGNPITLTEADLLNILQRSL
jgi:alcohol dehydrogenase class IV